MFSSNKRFFDWKRSDGTPSGIKGYDVSLQCSRETNDFRPFENYHCDVIAKRNLPKKALNSGCMI